LKSYFKYVTLKSKIKLQVTMYLLTYITLKVVNIFINIDTHLLLLYVTDKLLVPLTIYISTKNVVTKLLEIALYEKKNCLLYIVIP